MKLKPVGDRVVAKPLELEQETVSGIVLPETAREQPQMAKIITIGNIENEDIAEGDTVVFAKYAGTKLTWEGDELLILDSEDILGIIA